MFPAGASAHTARGSINPPFRWFTGASIATAPASPSTASHMLGCHGSRCVCQCDWHWCPVRSVLPASIAPAPASPSTASHMVVGVSVCLFVSVTVIGVLCDPCSRRAVPSIAGRSAISASNGSSAPLKGSALGACAGAGAGAGGAGRLSPGHTIGAESCMPSSGKGGPFQTLPKSFSANLTINHR